VGSVAVAAPQGVIAAALDDVLNPPIFGVYQPPKRPSDGWQSVSILLVKEPKGIGPFRGNLPFRLAVVDPAVQNLVLLKPSQQVNRRFPLPLAGVVFPASGVTVREGLGLP
jgi:hypothetical protein